MRCEDTDVLVLLVYYSSRGLLTVKVYMHTQDILGKNGTFLSVRE